MVGYSASMVHISSRHGRNRVVIVADKGSTVKNIVVGRERVDPDPNDWSVTQTTDWLEVSKRVAVYGAMLLFCIAFWVLTIVLLAKVAHASPLDCEQIKDVDQRHYCRAVAKPDKGECAFIKDHDLRQECRARVK